MGYQFGGPFLAEIDSPRCAKPLHVFNPSGIGGLTVAAVLEGLVTPTLRPPPPPRTVMGAPIVVPGGSQRPPRLPLPFLHSKRRDEWRSSPAPRFASIGLADPGKGGESFRHGGRDDAADPIA